jgi:hypothetical protein
MSRARIQFAKDGKTFADPFRPQHLVTRAGGTVLEVTACGHTLEAAANGFSRDDWHLVCCVSYPDSNDVETREFHPSQILYVGELSGPGHAESCALTDAMSDYLSRHGEWRDSKVRGWVAHREGKK